MQPKTDLRDNAQRSPRAGRESDKIESRDSQLSIEGGISANEFTFTMNDGKRLVKRVIAEGGLLA